LPVAASAVRSRNGNRASRTPPRRNPVQVLSPQVVGRARRRRHSDAVRTGGQRRTPGPIRRRRCRARLPRAAGLPRRPVSQGRPLGEQAAAQRQSRSPARLRRRGVSPSRSPGTTGRAQADARLGNHLQTGPAGRTAWSDRHRAPGSGPFHHRARAARLAAVSQRRAGIRGPRGWCWSRRGRRWLGRCRCRRVGSGMPGGRSPQVDDASPRLVTSCRPSRVGHLSSRTQPPPAKARATAMQSRREHRAAHSCLEPAGVPPAGVRASGPSRA
jgi:hypothetical protein